MAAREWADVAVGEQAAVYGYSVIAAKVPAAARKKATEAMEAHQRARDAARRRLARIGESPPTPVAFEVPPINDLRAGEVTAVGMEMRLIDQYLAVVAAAEGNERTAAAEEAQACARRARHWGWRPVAFPGSQAEITSNDLTPSQTAPAATQTQAPAVAPEGPPSTSPHDGAAIQ